MPRASVVTVLDLEGEADLWVRSEATHTEVTVIRGEAKLMIGTTGCTGPRGLEAASKPIVSPSWRWPPIAKALQSQSLGRPASPVSVAVVVAERVGGATRQAANIIRRDFLLSPRTNKRTTWCFEKRLWRETTMLMHQITKLGALAISLCLLAVPAVAQVVITQAKAIAGGVTPGDAAGFPVTSH